MNYRLNVRAIIPYKGKLLLARNKNLPGYWCLPGGGLDEGEELRGGLRREIYEETGIEPRIGRLLFIQQIGDGKSYNYPEFFFLVENGKDFENIDFTKATHASKELEFMKFIDVTKEPVLPEFLSSKVPELFRLDFDVPIEYVSS